MKLTPWYPGNIKPVRSGVYERDYGKYSYWNARKGQWGAWGAFISIAEKNSDVESSLQHQPWRGLAEKP